MADILRTFFIVIDTQVTKYLLIDRPIFGAGATGIVSAVLCGTGTLCLCCPTHVVLWSSECICMAAGLTEGGSRSCILLPLLFAVMIAWVPILKSTAGGSAVGIKWSRNSHLNDLEFADE